jgi:hypothetical protein
MMNRCFGLVMSTAFLAGLLAQVYVPFPDWHVYLVECAVFATWLICDAAMRRAKVGTALTYAAMALLLAPLAIPRWYANRPLRPGEWRKGGSEANFFTAFGVMTLIFTGVSAAVNFINFGPEKGFELIINSGFAVAGIALVMSLIARKERVFEKGPNRIPGAEEAE